MADLSDYIDKFEDGDLDDIIHDIKSGEASAINNCGVDVQLEYLFETLGALAAKHELQSILDARK